MGTQVGPLDENDHGWYKDEEADAEAARAYMEEIEAQSEIDERERTSAGAYPDDDQVSKHIAAKRNPYRFESAHPRGL